MWSDSLTEIGVGSYDSLYGVRDVNLFKAMFIVCLFYWFSAEDIISLVNFESTYLRMVLKSLRAAVSMV